MRMKLFFSILSLSIMSFFFSQQDTFTPTKRSEIASTFLNDKIYVAGGINFWGSNKRFETFDIKEGRWKRLPDLPAKLNHIGLAAYQDKVYLSGGFFNARQTKFSKLLYVYDISKAEWQELAEMPGERAAHFMIHRNHYLHLMGGRNHKAVWSYNLKSQEWEMDIIAPLPEKRDHISLLQDEQKLYLVGGRQQGIVKADCWEYDFKLKKWNTFAHLSTPRGGQSACLYNHKIHIIGGEDLLEGKTYAKHDIFDLKKEKWYQGKKLKTARHGFISELVHSNWYIYGGGKKAGIKTIFSTTSKMEILNLKEN